MADDKVNTKAQEAGDVTQVPPLLTPDAIAKIKTDTKALIQKELSVVITAAQTALTNLNAAKEDEIAGAARNKLKAVISQLSRHLENL